MTDPGADEADWILARGGDGRAAGRIFDRHHDRVHRHAVRLVPAPADAEDIVAIAFLEAWRRRDAVRFVDGSMLPWLLVTATNASRNIRRSARRYRALIDRLPPADTESETDAAIDAATGALVGRLRTLPLRDRQVLTLCVLHGYSTADAAAVLGVATGTVKSRLSRARRRLADDDPPAATPPIPSTGGSPS